MVRISYKKVSAVLVDPEAVGGMSSAFSLSSTPPSFSESSSIPGELDFEALAALDSGEDEAALLGATALTLPGARDGETDRSGGSSREVRGGRSGTWTTCQVWVPGGLT